MAKCFRGRIVYICKRLRELDGRTMLRGMVFRDDDRNINAVDILGTTLNFLPVNGYRTFPSTLSGHQLHMTCNNDSGELSNTFATLHLTTARCSRPSLFSSIPRDAKIVFADLFRRHPFAVVGDSYANHGLKPFGHCYANDLRVSIPGIVDQFLKRLFYSFVALAQQKGDARADLKTMLAHGNPLLNQKSPEQRRRMAEFNPGGFARRPRG